MRKKPLTEPPLPRFPESPTPALLQQSALLEAAAEARTRAYVPYSRFQVGAAVLAGGRVFGGCNVENASYGLTVCAERSAVLAAIAAGERTIEAVAIVTDTGGPTLPCGACRQVLHEFGPDVWVFSATLAGEQVVHRLRELLPAAFGPDHVAE